MTSSQLYISIHSLYERDKEFPSVEKISNETGVNKQGIEKALQYYLINGKLNLVEGQYRFPKSSRKQNSIRLFLRIITGIVGTGCILTSIKFTYSFNCLVMNRVWAFILSASLITFTSFCFTVKSFCEDKKYRGIFIFLYIVGISYSVFTAIAGQYNDFQKNSIEISENKMTESKNKLLLEQRENYLKRIEDYEKQLNAQHKIIDSLSESPERKYEYNNTWRQTNESAEKCLNKISELNEKISEIDNELNCYIEGNETLTIFEWLAEILHINSRFFQFLISLIPSMFIDLVSPFAIGFAFRKNL